MAVRAPTAGNVNEEDLALEPLVRVGDYVSVQIGESEGKRLRRIFDAGMLVVIGWHVQALGARLLGPDGGKRDVMVLGFEFHGERPVARRRHYDQRRARAGE